MICLAGFLLLPVYPVGNKNTRSHKAPMSSRWLEEYFHQEDPGES